jgi:hypothetical protein
MYLRYTTRKKDGKVHRTWRLVRSVRIGRRVIQQTVTHLGELDEAGRLRARALARALIGEPEQADLFDDGTRDQTIGVRLKGVRVENGRQFGNVYLALALWRACQLDEFVSAHIPAGKEEVPWEKMVAVLVAARLCEPSSELHIAEDWYRRTALSDLLQLNEALVNKDRLYRALDRLLPHKAALEAHLSKRVGELFAVDNEVLLYDVTSIYFEGEAAANAQAQRGYSRDHRPDCKQVCIALVVTFDGFPLGYEVFPGNTHDSTTVQTIVETMEARHGTVGKVWIMDRGMASAENVTWLRESGRRYILGTPKSELRKWAPALAQKTHWREIREDIEVKLCAAPEGAPETFILCRSKDRIEKEKAMHARFSARIEQALAKLQRRIAQAKKLLNRDAINRQIGRLLQRNQRAAARFAIELKDADTPAGCTLKVSIREDFDQWAALSEGAYVLRSNVTEVRRESMEGLHPTHASRGRLPHPERSTGDSPHLAPARGSRASAYPRVLPRLCAVEDARAVAGTRWPGQFTAHPARRAGAHSSARRDSADAHAWRDSTALCHPTRCRTSRTARSSRRRVTEKNPGTGNRRRDRSRLNNEM